MPIIQLSMQTPYIFYVILSLIIPKYKWEEISNTHTSQFFPKHADVLHSDTCNNVFWLKLQSSKLIQHDYTFEKNVASQ